MKLNNLEKCVVLLTAILVCIAGISQYKVKNNFNNKIQKLISYQSGSHQEDFPDTYKKIAKEHKIFENLYDNDEVILTYNYEDVPMQLHMGKDFHNDFTKKLEKEKLNFKVITYRNYEDQKHERLQKEGKNESCTMITPEEKEYSTFLTKTEDCLANVCIIDNKNNKYTLINRENIDYAISVLKELNQHTN